MTMMRLCLGAGFALMLSLSATVSLADDGEANALFVQAVQSLAAAENSGDDETRYQATKKAVEALDKIVAEHPSSALAVQIITGQKIGTIDPNRLRARLKSFEASRARASKRAAEKAAEAAKPFVLQKAPRIRTARQMADCIATLECFAKLEMAQIRQLTRARRGDQGGRFGPLAAALYLAGRRGPNLQAVIDAAAAYGRTPYLRGDYVVHYFAAVVAEEGIAATVPKLLAYAEQAAGQPKDDTAAGLIVRDVVEQLVRHWSLTLNEFALRDEWIAALQAQGFDTGGKNGLSDIAQKARAFVAKVIEHFNETGLDPADFTKENARQQLRLYSMLSTAYGTSGDPRYAEARAQERKLITQFLGQTLSPISQIRTALLAGNPADAIPHLEAIKSLKSPAFSLQDVVEYAALVQDPAFRKAAVALEADMMPKLWKWRRYDTDTGLRRTRLIAVGLRAGMQEAQ